jgi:succinoglycan biosynthesis transport protein ExoP
MNAHRDLTPPDLAVQGSLEHAGGLQPPVPVAMRSVSAVSQEDVFFHLDLLRSLQLHSRLFVLILAVGLAAAAGYFFTAWPVYNADCLVYIRPAPPRLMAGPGVQSWPYDDITLQSFIQQQLKNVTRNDVLRAAVNKLPAGSWLRNSETEQQAVERLGRAIKVERLDGSYQVAITAKASDSSLAAALANAVAASFVESARMDLRAGDPQRIQLLGEELERVKKALVADRAEQEQLNRSLGVANLGSKVSEPFDVQIETVRIELGKARAAHDEAAARLTSLAATASDSTAAMDAEADERIIADPGLVSMKASLNQRRALLISQMANLTPNHPQYKQNAEELAQINASLEKMMKELRAKAAAHIEQRLRNDLERTSAYETRLNGQLAQMSGVASSVTPRLQRASDLAIDIERLQNRYTQVDEQYRNLSIENQAPGAVYVSSPALPPLQASWMHLLRNIVIILLGALVIALGAAVVAHNLDPRVYIAADVERVLGFSPMAQLPDFRQVSSSVGEEYMLRLAAAIEHAYQQNGLKSCIITGAAPGAGTSTVASRVTTMLEGMGRSTVLVDASGTPPPPKDLKIGADPFNHLVSTRVDNSPSSLLQQMAEETDAETIVLTDTAPLLASGETEYLARFVDSAIVVIQSGLTTRAQLREVAQTLQRLEVAAVGFVLNRVSIQKANPSFRQSVRAVEQRLAVQNRLRARHSQRTRPSAQHQSEVQEPSVVTETDDAKQPDLSPSQDASPQPVISAEPVAASVPASANSRHAVPETEPAAAHVPRGRGEPRRPAPAVRAPRPSAVPPPPAPEPLPSEAATAAPRRPVPAAPEQPHPPISASRAATSPSSRPAAAPAATAAPGRWAPPAPPPDQSEPLPDDQPSERDDAGYAAASRLGGLRNLLVSLGRRSMNNDGEAGEEPDLEPRFERATMRPAYPDSPLPGADAPHNDNPARLTAQPEFLPPKPAAEVEKEKEAVRPAPRRENLDPEEIQTLPSWRGQYRKKRYPPM